MKASILSSLNIFELLTKEIKRQFCDMFDNGIFAIFHGGVLFGRHDMRSSCAKRNENLRSVVTFLFSLGILSHFMHGFYFAAFVLANKWFIKACPLNKVSFILHHC